MKAKEVWERVRAQSDPVALRQERAAILDYTKGLLDRAEQEGRGLTADEERDFKGLLDVADYLSRKIAEIESAWRPVAGRAYPPGWGAGGPVYSPELPPDRFSFVRAIRGMATGRWVGCEYEERALAVSSDPAGGYLVSAQVAAEVIDLLRPNLAMAQLPGVQFLTPERVGSLTVPRLGASATAYWVGENADIAESQPTFEQVLLAPHKLAALVAVSNELLADATVAAEQIIRADLGRVLAAAADLGYLRGSGTGAEPKGIRNQTGIEEIPVNAALDYDALVDALVAVQGANANPTGWIMHPRVKGALLKLKDQSGRPIFVTDMSAAPRDLLFGLPVIYTSQIPTNLGAGQNETEIYCVDGTTVMVAIWKQITLDATNSGAIWDGTRAISAFQRDQTLIRAIMRVDVGLRHPEAVSVLTGVVLS